MALLGRPRYRRGVTVQAGLLLVMAMMIAALAMLADPMWPVLMMIASVLVAILGWPALAELDNRRFVPRSMSRLYQVVQLGTLCVGITVGVSLDAVIVGAGGTWTSSFAVVLAPISHRFSKRVR